MLALLAFPLGLAAQEAAQATAQGTVQGTAQGTAQETAQGAAQGTIQGTAEPADWRFAHPGATLVGGVRVRALLASPILKAVLEDATAKDPNVASAVGMAQSAIGQVEELRFSFLDLGKQADGKQNVDALVMVTGPLDPSLAAALTQGQAQFRRLDENTILLGTDASLEAALQRIGQPPELLKNRALLRGGSMAGDDLWFAGSLPALPMTAAVADDLRGLAVGFNVSGDLTLEVALETTSPEKAEALLRMAREAEAQQPQMAGKLETSIEDTVARLRVTIPQADALEAIRTGAAAKLFTQMGAALPGAPQAGKSAAEAPRQPKPQRHTIIIDGLEGGPREIPVEPR